MSREIKFRAWDRYRQEFVNPAAYVSLFNARNDSCVAIATPDGTHIKLSQFTGLKDKNGVEIYERDIVKHGLKNGIILWAPYVSPGYIIFTPKGHYIEDDYNGTYNTLDARIGAFGYSNKLEVIGNIYESSELFKESV